MVSNMFQNTSQLDVTTVLMLIGEATIWKAVWTRMRGRQAHWTHYLFAVSPGWTPLAGTLFAAMNGGVRPFNLIYERIPEGCCDRGLKLTNLNSGATHSADQTILQNIWETWSNGVDALSGSRLHENELDITKEVGVMSVDLDQLKVSKPLAIGLHSTCLVLQVSIAIVTFIAHLNQEVLVLVIITLCCQALLIAAVTPRSVAWERMLRNYRSSAVMLHKGHDSTRVLIIPRAYLRRNAVNLEELCWKPPFTPDAIDKVKVAMAAIALLGLALSILMVDWMEGPGRTIYLVIGALGFFANALDATMLPNWTIAFGRSFNGAERCAPYKSSLMGGVGVLVAGRFSCAIDVAGLLYPNNLRLRDTLQSLRYAFDTVCTNCRLVIREGFDVRPANKCTQTKMDSLPQEGADQTCAETMMEKARACDATQKQMSDALATVAKLLAASQGSDKIDINTAEKNSPYFRHSWW